MNCQIVTHQLTMTPLTRVIQLMNVRILAINPRRGHSDLIIQAECPSTRNFGQNLRPQINPLPRLPPLNIWTFLIQIGYFRSRLRQMANSYGRWISIHQGKSYLVFSSLPSWAISNRMLMDVQTETWCWWNHLTLQSEICSKEIQSKAGLRFYRNLRFNRLTWFSPNHFIHRRTSLPRHDSNRCKDSLSLGISHRGNVLQSARGVHCRRQGVTCMPTSQRTLYTAVNSRLTVENNAWFFSQ